MLKRKLKLFRDGVTAFKFVTFLHGNMFSAKPIQRFKILCSDGVTLGDYFIPLEEAETVYTKAFWESLTTDLKDT